MRESSGDKAATHEAAADGGALRWIPDVRSRRVLRDAARDAPGMACHRPKTPIGRRGVSLIYLLRTTARGKGLAGPFASLYLILRGFWPPDASACVASAETTPGAMVRLAPD